MKITGSEKKARAQLALLLIATVVLLTLSFLPNSRTAISSSETKFSELSAHGLNIVPASCASSASYYHTALSVTADGGGYVSPSDGGEDGAYNAALYSAGTSCGIGCVTGASSGYFCVINSTGSTYFIPARTANELNTALNALPGRGISVYTR
jgi:hypothetical protein